MVERKYWINLIEKSWQARTIVWLSGVRRVGKTVLCQSLSNAEYYDCERPRVRRMMEDAEGFLENMRGKRIALDEIHRLDNPSELLKIAADHYRDVKIIATGSSSLGASSKFSDTLAGRKIDIWLPPMILADLNDFGNADICHRLLFGGLPPFFMSDSVPEVGLQEWIDAFWAKDIQELFRLERKASFQKFVELVFIHSGGIFEATRYATPCEVSRTTISNYLHVLEATYVAHIIRPFSTHRASEITAAPKVYAFDTAFVCAFRGWDKLRNDDLGYLWEHLVLNELQAAMGRRPICYWRDKRGHEVDFVLNRRGKKPVAIECKWSAKHFEPDAIAAFHRRYADCDYIVVAHDIERSYTKHFGDLKINFHSLESLINKYKQSAD
jgi:uncharacterized protein